MKRTHGDIFVKEIYFSCKKLRGYIWSLSDCDFLNPDQIATSERYISSALHGSILLAFQGSLYFWDILYYNMMVIRRKSYGSYSQMEYRGCSNHTGNRDTAAFCSQMVLEAAFGHLSGAVNSTWEHLKLIFWPMFLFGIVEYIAYGRKTPGFLPQNSSQFFSACPQLSCCSIPIQGILGYHIPLVDIFLFIIGTVGAYIFF